MKTTLNSNNRPFQERPRKSRPKTDTSYSRHLPNRNEFCLKNDHKSYSEDRLMMSNDIEKEPGPKTSTCNDSSTCIAAESDNNSNRDNTNYYMNEKLSNTKGNHRAYSKNKLIKSGDVETQPGPNSKKKKDREIPCLHIISLIILLIVTINKIKKEQDKILNSPQSSRLLEYRLYDFTNILLQNVKRDIKKFGKTNSAASHLAILLIIAGDVKLNPGPKQVNKCIQCKKVAQKETAVNCETCNGWSHLLCTESTKQVAKISSQSFDWICPNPNCKPNHQTASETNFLPTPNRYQILTEQVEEPKKVQRIKRSPKKEKRNNKQPTTTTEENLFNHLPKINAKDYIGKEICRACHKTVANSQKRISCDECYRWTHLNCSDMSTNTYNQNKNKEFPWICNTCRTSETSNYDKIDLQLLNTNQLPITNSELLDIKDSNLLILHYNCRSMINKETEVHNICKDLEPSILCLTETWLDNSASLDSYTPTGYSIIRNDRSDIFKQKYGKNNGGGIAVLYKEELKIRKLDINTGTEETLWVEVKAKPNLILGTVYRASYTNLLTETEKGSELETQLSEATSKTNKVIVLGDFNCNTALEHYDKPTNDLNSIFENFSMKQMINKPTRIDLKTNKVTTIDHVWVDPEMNLLAETGTIEGISDHVGIFVKTNSAKIKTEPQKVRYRNYKNYEPDDFNAELKEELNNPNLRDLIDAEKVDDAMELWVRIFLNIAAKHAPIIEKVQTKRIKKIPWFTKDLEAQIEEKRNKLKLYRLYGLWTDLKLVKAMTNNITHVKRMLKKSYYSEKLQQYRGDSKKIWKILKGVTQTDSRNSTIEPEFINQEKANQFNRYFATVGSKIQEKLNVEEKDNTSTSNTETGNFQFHEETEETIKKLIDRIKNDIAVGADDINAKLLKDTKQTIAETLTQLVNISYKTSKFPTCMKKALVKPVHKKDNTEDPANYRPLSILSIVSKVFERSATNQLVQYLEENNLLTKTQHAYRKGHSTQTCLNEIVNYIYAENDAGNIVGIASLDLSKAFDSVNHSHLLRKLNKLGLGKNSLHWCRSYLTGRTQQTKFQKYTSTNEIVTSGVPQGSILGPILFICFTNDMPENLQNSAIFSYADDSQILVSAKTGKQVKRKLEELINNAQQWYTKNSLLNNATKTEVMLVSKTKYKEIFDIDIIEERKKKKLKLKTSIKILGVHLDQELNWNKQVAEVNKKARYSSRKLQRINHLLPFKSRLLLYNSLVAPHFNYADTVWGGCNQQNKNKLQRTQNSVVKSIIGMKNRESSEEALKKTNLLTLERKRKVHEAVYTHKALAGKLPAAVTEHYNQHTSLKNFRSADRQILTVPRHSKENFKNSPIYRTINTWNSVPPNLKKAETTTFKHNYQAYLQNTSKP